MPTTEQVCDDDWEPIGWFPLEHATAIQAAFMTRFPSHRTAFLSMDGHVRMLVTPPLTVEDRAAWQELYEQKRRGLGL